MTGADWLLGADSRALIGGVRREAGTDWPRFFSSHSGSVMAAAFPFAVLVGITAVIALPDAATQRPLRPGTARPGGGVGEELERVRGHQNGVKGHWNGVRGQ